MTRLVDLLLHGASSGGPPSGARTVNGYGACLAHPSYYGYVYPFSNMIRQGGGWNDQTYVDAAGWLQNLPAGASKILTMTLGIDQHTGFFPPGNYIATTASGLHCTMAGASGLNAMVDGTSAANPSATFTIPALANSLADYATNMIVKITVTNGTAGPLSCSDIYVGLVSSKAGHDAGDPFSPQYIADLAGINCIRLADWNGQNGVVTMNDGNLDFSLLITEANRLWAYDAWPNLVPYSLCAKLAAKLDCILWFNVAMGREDLWYSSDLTTDILTTKTGVGAAPTVLANHGYALNDQICLWGYEHTVPGGLVENTIYYAKPVAGQPTQLQLAATPGGAAINLTTNIVASYGSQIQHLRSPLAFYRNIVAALHAAAPGITVVGQVGLECWNPGYYLNYCQGPASVQAIGTGYNAGAGMAWYQLQLWKAIEELYPRAQNIRMTESQAVAYTNLAGALPYVDPGFVQAGATVGALSDCWSLAPYIDAYDPAFNIGVDNGGNGEYIDQLITAGASTWSDAQWTAAFQRGLTYMQSQMTTCITAMHADAPGKRVICYEGGQNVYVNGGINDPKYKTFADRLLAYISSAGAGTYSTAYNAMLNNCGVKSRMQYVHAARWNASNTAIVAWGGKRAHELPDTPYLATARGFVPT